MDFDANFFPPNDLVPSLFEDDDSRWEAVKSRNASADGFFFYGVRTTKIYCRPICKARLARRANVRYFLTGREAQEAGFRACKRCKPEVDGFMPEDDAVQKIRAFVREQDTNGGGCGARGSASGGSGASRMSLNQMAKQTGLSKWHFHRVFKRCVGMTPTEYLRMQRNAPAAHIPDMDADMSRWLEDFDPDLFDLGYECDPIFFMASASASGSGSGTSSSESQTLASPLPFSDLLSWPEVAVPPAAT